MVAGGHRRRATGPVPPGTETPKRRLEEGRRRFGGESRDDGRVVPSPPWAEVGQERIRSGSVQGRIARFGEVAGAAHLAKEEQLVDLGDGPVRLADRDAGEIGGLVGGLV